MRQMLSLWVFNRAGPRPNPEKEQLDSCRDANIYKIELELKEQIL